MVDDDPALRLLLRASLEQEGLAVVEAENGADALAKFDRVRPDIVLLDVLMPELDGFATCRELRARAHGRRTPILMLTGLEDVESVDGAYRAGATDFVHKPVNWTMFGHRIRYILRTSRAVNELAASQARLAKSQRVARLGSWEWEPATGQVYRSDEIHALAGIGPEAFPARPSDLLALVHPEDRERVRDAAVRWSGAGGPEVIEFRLLRPDGTIRSALCQVEAERDAAGALVRLHGIVQDVTERRQAEERIRHLAYYDTVTGLPNRAWLLERLDMMIAHARRRKETMAVMFLDLDQFKRINDTLGHAAGDAMLGEVAARIAGSVRRGDVVGRSGAHGAGASVARLGGDEFCILLGAMRRTEDAATVATRLLEAFRQPFVLEGFEAFASASIGIAVYPHDGSDGAGLLKAADTAMYLAKDEGRNTYKFYSRALNTRAVERLALEGDLRRALEKDEFTLHYQVQVGGPGRRVVGIEALLRWNHPVRGLVEPAQFVAVAEECRQIVPIEEWVLRTACRQNKAWQSAGARAVPVSVNLSGQHFGIESLAEKVGAALDESGLAPEHLKLEITESVLAAGRENVTANLHRLRQLGVRLSLDDFGTGHSSLGCLKRLPLSELKIDRSFAGDIVGNADSAAIVSAIVAIGRSLDLELVAEGVENEDQHDCLRMRGCDVMQGFLFGPPLPAEAIATLLAPGREWTPSARR